MQPLPGDASVFVELDFDHGGDERGEGQRWSVCLCGRLTSAGR